LDKNNIMMIVIIALLVILLGTIGFMSVYLITFFKDANNPTAQTSQNGEEIQVSQDQLLMVAYDTAVKGTIPGVMDESGKAATHAVTFKVSVGIRNDDKKKVKDAEALQALLTDRESIVKSYVSDIIYNHTYTQYEDNDVMKATLSREILERLKMEFGTELVYKVYLSDYLYQ